MLLHSNEKRRRRDIIAVFFMICFLLQWGGATVAQGSPSAELDEAKKMDAVLVIDNSGSMDWQGHDPEGSRFEGAKIFIDKSEEGDNIALVDFSGSSLLLLPLTKVTRERKTLMKKLVSTVRSDRKLTNINSALELALQELGSDRADPLHIPVVILLTDGEIDVVEGTPAQKRLAAQRSEKILLSKTLPAYPKNYIPIYTIALKSVIDTSLLQTLAEKSKLPQQANEEHYFQVSSDVDLVEIFSKIISQIKKQPRVAERFHFTGEPIKQTTTTTPFTKKIGFDVILDHKENMDITLKNPEGEIVKPTSQEKKYNFYEVNKPQVGQWEVSVEGKGKNEVILATFRDEDITIDLPFPSRFKFGDKILIFANVKYKGNIVEESTVVDLSGRKRVFSIKQLLLLIQKPDGQTDGPFALQKRGGSYTYFYENADVTGKYILNFKLIGDLEGEEVQNEAQKEVSVFRQKAISVFRSVGRPVVSFEKLKEKYTLGSMIELRIVVKENAELMQPSSIKVNVHAPIGGKVLSIPRKGLELYSLTFTETEKKGKYTFTIEKSEDYEAIEYQQSVSVMPSFVIPWRLFIILVTTFIVIVGLTAAAIKLRVWILARKSRLLVEEFQKKTQPEIIKDVGTTFAMPDEILLWEYFVAVEQIYFFKQDGIYSIICAVGNDVIHNDVAISGREKITLDDGDTIRVGGLGFKVELEENMPEKVSLYYLENVMIRIYRMTDGVRWLVKNIGTQPLQVGDIIPLNFIKGNILYVGQDEGLHFTEPNDIGIPNPTVASRQISIRKDNSSYFLTALDGKTILNGRPLEHEDEMELEDGDIVKIGDLMLLVMISGEKPQFKLIEYHD